jgi:hypothetical protein
LIGYGGADILQIQKDEYDKHEDLQVAHGLVRLDV